VRRERKMSMDSSTHMKIALAEEWREILLFKQLNEDMMRHLCFSIRWIIRYTRKNNLPLPELERMENLLNEAMSYADKIEP
jgi:hypothetical protein